MKYLTLLAAGAACIAAAGESLVKDGSFDLSKDSPSAEYSPRPDCRFELFTEDLSWNKCAELVAGAAHDGGAVAENHADAAVP